MLYSTQRRELFHFGTINKRDGKRLMKET